MLRPAAMLIAAALCGCALVPLREADCRVADWRERGYRDGFGGHPPQDLRLAAECPRFGASVPASVYLEGWRAGYDEYDRLKTMKDF